MNGDKLFTVTLKTNTSAKIRKWRVKEGAFVSAGKIIFVYYPASGDPGNEPLSYKSNRVGIVRKLLAKEGDVIEPGGALLQLGECTHPTIMKELCAECGKDLSREERPLTKATVPMVHSIPELKISEEEARILGKEDEKRLIEDRKLVLLVDLDQTLVHTTNDEIQPNLKDVHDFKMFGPNSPWYHTKIRPKTVEFLEEISKYYEMHICTFGARIYAHTVAKILDPDGKFFSHRILSRDECFDPNSKTANLKSLFPCGDNMVCIIDDREDVWDYAPNLIHVKPYHFFKNTGDINAPLGLVKKETDEDDEFDFSNLGSKSKESEKNTKVKVESPGESTSDKDTEDEVEKRKTKKEEIEKITKGLQQLENGEENFKGINIKTEDIDMTDQDIKIEEKIVEVVDTPDSTVRDGNEILKNGEPVNDETESQSDRIEVEETDDYLMYLEDILKSIHKAFYEAYDTMDKENKTIPDLKVIIREVKQKVLQGCNLAFSALVPSHVPIHQSKAYKVAISLGATVSPDVSADVTHLIAAKLGTAKVNSSKKIKGIRIVTPRWLWNCAERWERLDERLYPLGLVEVGDRIPPAHCCSPEQNAKRCNPNGRSPAPSERFMDTINPLLRFSSKDIRMMNQEVIDLCTDDDDSDDDYDDESEESSSSLARHLRHGDDEPESDNERFKNFIRARSLKATDDDSSSSNDSLSGVTVPKGWSEKKVKARKRKAEELTTCTESDFEDEFPSVRFRRGEPLPSDLDFGDEQESQDSPESDDPDAKEWERMGAELEKEF